LPDKTSRSQEENDVEARFVCHRSVCGRVLADVKSADQLASDLSNGEVRTSRQSGNPLPPIGYLRPGLATPLSTETTLSEPENRLVEKPEQGLLVVDRARSK
jgi:hypothetical protein